MNTPFRTPGVPGLLTDDALAEQMKQFTQAQNAQAQAAPPPDAAVEFADRIQSEYLSAPARRIKTLAPAAGPLGPLISGLASSTAKSQASGPPTRDETFGGRVAMNPFVSLMQGGALNAAGTLTDGEAQVEAQAKFEQAQKDEAAVLKSRDELIARQEAERQQTSFGGLGAEVDEDARREALAQMDLNVAEAQAETKTRKEGLTDRTKQPTQTWWLSAIQGGMRSFAQTPVTAAKAPISAWEGVSAALTGQSWEKSDLREWVDKVDKALTQILPGDKTRSKEFVDQLGQGSGSMAAYMMAGYISTVVGLPSAAFGFAVGAQSQLEDAEQHDGVGLQKYLSFLLGGAFGTTDMFTINRMFMRAEQATGGMVSRMFRNAAAGSGEEFLQEFVQSFGTDVVARWLYDENRDIDIKSYVQQGLVGAVIGGAAGTSASVAGQAGLTPDQIAAQNIPDAEKTSIVERVLAGLQSDFEAEVGVQEEADIGVDQPLAKTASAADVVQGPGGSIPVNEAGQFDLRHWSSTALEEIDPAKRGTGPLKGAERARLVGDDAVDRSYYGAGRELTAEGAADQAELAQRVVELIRGARGLGGDAGKALVVRDVLLQRLAQVAKLDLELPLLRREVAEAAALDGDEPRGRQLPVLRSGLLPASGPRVPAQRGFRGAAPLRPPCGPGYARAATRSPRRPRR